MSADRKMSLPEQTSPPEATTAIGGGEACSSTPALVLVREVYSHTLLTLYHFPIVVYKALNVNPVVMGISV